MNSMLALHPISEDTKAILTLCSRWVKGNPTAKPLTDSEYNLFVQWLSNRSLRPQAIFDPDFATRYCSDPISSIPPDRILQLLEQSGVLFVLLERWLNSGFWVISRADEHYPQRFRKLKSKAPPLLYGVGDVSLLDSKTIGFVGSRKVRPELETVTRELAAQCAAQHITVVSGGAKGVDLASMNGALESGGKVIGIMANDLSRTIAQREARIAVEDNRLVLLSPFHPEAGFDVGNAMGRNKLIYAASDAIIVVQSSYNQGGTWAGVRENHASNYCKVFVYPDNYSVGNREIVLAGWGQYLPDEAKLNPRYLLETAFLPPDDELFFGQQISNTDVLPESSSFVEDSNHEQETLLHSDKNQLGIDGNIPLLLRIAETPKTKAALVKELTKQGITNSVAIVERAITNGDLEIVAHTGRVVKYGSKTENRIPL